MSHYSVSHLSDFINQQLVLHEKLNEALAKATALSTIMLSDDFHDFTGSVRYDYIWTLSDIIQQAKTTLDDVISQLLIQNG